MSAISPAHPCEQSGGRQKSAQKFSMSSGTNASHTAHLFTIGRECN